MALERLDVALVRRGLARSRTQAERLVREGRVHLAGVPVTKTSRKVEPDAALTVEAGEHPDYVGRGALKLAGVLDELAGLGAAPVVSGRRCLDAGASTGGFTEVLLRRGADEVVAVDVGHDQLDASLRAHPQVRELSGTSVRGLQPDAVGGPVDLVVGDLSFISLQLVLTDLVALAGPGADLLLLVKPQFEVGKSRLGSGGVVRDPRLRADALVAVARAGQALGLVVRALRPSRWPGPSGNVEYFVWFSAQDDERNGGRSADPLPRLADDDLPAAAQRAVEEGPA
ncbi:MAG TPA: TlyA family RNA methyltransferase [Angustibacter sp.]|nr:TlyA family RNA methyltransferase [Angustibacter sp.]